MTGARLRLAIHQFAPELGGIRANARRIVTAAGEAEADLVVTPELSLTGYHVEDAAATLGCPVTAGQSLAIPTLSSSTDLVVGLVEQGPDAVSYNAAVHLRGDRVRFRHRKVYLPTYGLFDEMRFFGRGRGVEAYDMGDGWRAGLLVCEDLWHPALPYLLAVQGVNILIVQAAAPGRGVWEGGERGGRFASWDAWERIARTTADLYGVYVALANRTGVERGVMFAGGSMIVGPSGDRIVSAPVDEAATITAELSLAEVSRARRPGSHARDEDPHLVLRELQRILGPIDRDE